MSKIKKTVITLADGRELIYFDDSVEYVNGDKKRCEVDERPLENRYTAFYDDNGKVKEDNLPQMRYDILMGEWIPMATHRMNRTFLPPRDANPLGPKKIGAKYSDGEIPDTDYDVVVFENRFPSLLEIPEADNSLKILDDNELFLSKPANGRCEVVCFGPNIDQSLVEMGPKRMRTVIEAWADRTKELMRLDTIQQVFCFENHGEAIGVTLQHPHGQIYAYPYATPRMKTMLYNVKTYFEKTGKNLFDNLIESYKKSQPELIIHETDKWILYVPFAAKWPLEMHLMPKRHVNRIDQLDEEEKEELSKMYLQMIKTANKFFEYENGTYLEVPYISAWNQAPKDSTEIRLFCDFFSFQRSIDKLKYLAGSESGMQAWISDTTPEKIAKRLKEVFVND